MSHLATYYYDRYMAYEHRTDAERSRQAKLAELTPLADRKLLLKTCIHTAGKMLANQRTSLNEVRDARETDAAEIARRARVEDDVAFDATRVRFVSAERALLQALDYRLFMATPQRLAMCIFRTIIRYICDTCLSIDRYTHTVGTV